MKTEQLKSFFTKKFFKQKKIFISQGRLILGFFTRRTHISSYRLLTFTHVTTFYLLNRNNEKNKVAFVFHFKCFITQLQVP